MLEGMKRVELLITELRPYLLVGMVGFEPTTSSFQMKQATWLPYTPIVFVVM